MIHQVLHAQLAMTMSRHLGGQPHCSVEDLLGFRPSRGVDDATKVENCHPRRVTGTPL